MEAFLNFLRDNWKFLAEILLLLVSFIVLLLQKKIKVSINSNVWSLLSDNLPRWILAAEEQFGSGNGKEKLKFVLSNAVSFVASKLGLEESVVLSYYGNDIVDKIESILNTPQKKGDQ